MALNITNAQRAEVLTQALPYIQKYYKKIVVIKYGGNAMINEDLKQQVMEDIVLLSLSVFNVVDFFGALISVTLINMGINTFSVWRDIKQPKLIYNNIRELVISSSKTLMSMLISLVVAIVGLALYIGIPFAGLEKYAASAAIWGAMTAFAIIVFCVFRINSVKRMSEGIERIE